MHQECEIRIQALCKRLQHLESEAGDGVNRSEGSRLAQVERQLAKQTDLYNEQVARASKLQVDFNKVFNDYNAQLNVSLLKYTCVEQTSRTQCAYLLSLMTML